MKSSEFNINILSTVQVLQAILHTIVCLRVKGRTKAGGTRRRGESGELLNEKVSLSCPF